MAGFGRLAQLCLVAIGILHFRDHWTGIIAPCSGLTTSHSSLFPLLFFHYFCIGDSSPEIHDLLNITHMHQRFKLKSCKFCSEDKEPAQPAIVNRFIKNRYSIYIWALSPFCMTVYNTIVKPKRSNPNFRFFNMPGYLEF